MKAQIRNIVADFIDWADGQWISCPGNYLEMLDQYCQRFSDNIEPTELEIKEIIKLFDKYYEYVYTTDDAEQRGEWKRVFANDVFKLVGGLPLLQVAKYHEALTKIIKKDREIGGYRETALAMKKIASNAISKQI